VSTLVDPALRREMALARLMGRIDYERRNFPSPRSGELKLQRMRDLLDRLGNPQKGQRIVHVAGTKGKGSTAAMIASCLSAAGLRTGIYTSPHLQDVEERFTVDRAACPADRFADLVETIWPHVEAMDRELSPSTIGPTYFELTTALALLHFKQEATDATVLEVGLGGRLDATNVCRPALSLIVSISFDHMQQLGNTLGSIAREKAGIIKQGVPVISGVTDPEPRDVIRAVAAKRKAPLLEIETDFRYRYQTDLGAASRSRATRLDFQHRLFGSRGQMEDVSVGLLGRHQATNAAVVLAALHALQHAGWPIDEDAMRRGLAATRVQARTEAVWQRPCIVVDAAHNVASIDALLATIEESFAASRRVLIFATTMGKDVAGMCRSLAGRFDRVILTRYWNNPRALPIEELAAQWKAVSEQGVESVDDPVQAWQIARQALREDDLLCITGSFFIATELRRRIQQDLA